MSPLLALPLQPAELAWPTDVWPQAKPAPEVDRVTVEKQLDLLFAEPPSVERGRTKALVIIHRGSLVAERYGVDGGRDTPLCSWSMAKSITHALVGVLVREGRLEVLDPAPVPEWQAPGDPRRAITTDHLLRMCDGLDFVEDYVDQGVSHVIDMLFQSGKPDVAGYTAARPLAHPPGRHWNYSSGTSNIVSRIVGGIVGGGEAGMRAFMDRELFGRIGMTSADPRFDEAGTFIGSSFVFATARDFARFGLLYLRDGVWEDERVLPPGWVDHGRTLTAASLDQYGAHWWLATDGSGIFNASGYEGQYLVIDPSRDLLLVRLGSSSPEQRARVVHSLAAIVRAFPLVGRGGL